MTSRFSTHAVPSAVLLACLALAGCGGGGGTPASTAAPLSGTAAVGAALANATVTLKDGAGKTLTTTADANGAYTFADVSGLTAPLMLRASGTVGGVEYKLHSVLTTVPAAGVSGVLNVTPATESAVAQTLGTSPATVFDAADASAKIKAIDTTKLAAAKAKLVAALSAVLEALGQDAKADLFTTAFAANGKGLDKLLDMMQFEASDDGAGNQDVVITDKTTKVGTKVTTAAKVEEIAKVSAPSKADIDLETSTIKAFIDAFNAQAKTKEGITSAAMLALFDAAYLNSGMSRADQIQDILSSVGLQITDYALQGCDSAASGGAECKTQMTIKFADGNTTQMANKMKKGADGQWRAYGNQSPFDFDFKPLVTANYYVANGLFEQSGSTQTGVNFWFTGTNYDTGVRAYKSVILQTSVDNGTTWSTPIKFAEKSNCSGNDWLPLDDSTNTSNAYNCSNFVSVSNAEALANNEAILKGTFKYKITAYTGSSYTNTNSSDEFKYVARSTKQYYTTATGKAAMDASTASVTAGDLGTNSVRFTGPLKNLTINTVTKNAAGNTIATANTGWEDSALGALKGVATIAAANASCVKNGTPKTQCDASYGSDAKITSVYLDSRDSQGRGISKSYRAVGGSTTTAAPTAVQ